MTDAQITKLAQDIVTAANLVKAAYNRSRELLAYNTVANLDWNGMPAEPIAGTDALPSDISNAIGAMAELKDYWEGQAVATANYGQLYEKLAFPFA